MIEEIKAALRRMSGSVRAGLDKLQAGARSTQGQPLNYASVHTLAPSRLAAAFAAADQGQITEQAALFELVEEQDPHLFSEMAKRRRAVTGLGWQLQPRDDADASELRRTGELADMLKSIPRFEDAQYDLTDAIGKGFAALEIEWKAGSTWLPQNLLWVPQRMFRIDRNTGALQFLKLGMPQALRPWGWIIHEHRAKSGYIEQAALFRVLAWTYAYKAYNVQDMQRFLEVYGMPLRLGKYPGGAPAQQRAELLRAVRNIGQDGAGIVPNTMSIDFVQAKMAGTVSDFLSAIEYWERKQSLAILGGTLTSQADGKTSTNALGAIHDKVRREIMLHDVNQITPGINHQLIRPIALINGLFAEDRLPSFRYLTEETVDQAKMADVLTKAASMGMEIDVEYAHQVMQIPRADKKAKMLVPPGRALAQTPASALTRLAALSASRQAEPDIASAYSAQLAAICAPMEQKAIQQIAAIIAQSGDFDEAIGKIETLSANNPAWAQALALGMEAAVLAGMDAATSEGDE